MRILVTGATGFIGQRLTQHLLRRGDTVLALGRRSCGVAGVENIQVAALEPDCIAQALQGRSFDAVMQTRPEYANRISYVIAPDGSIVYHYMSLNPAKHVEKTLDALKSWEKK